MDRNSDVVPFLRMHEEGLYQVAADEIEQLRGTLVKMCDVCERLQTFRPVPPDDLALEEALKEAERILRG